MSGGGAGGLPTPTPPQQGEGFIYGGIPGQNLRVISLSIVGGGRWRLITRTERGQVIHLGTTDVDGTAILIVPAGTVLLDIPEAGVFGLPLQGSGQLRVVPQG